MTFDTEVSTEVADRIAEIGRSVVVPKRLTREECTTPELRLEYIAQWLEAGAPARGMVSLGFACPTWFQRLESLRQELLHCWSNGSLAVSRIPECWNRLLCSQRI